MGFVVHRDVQFGIGRMIEKYAELRDLEFRVFRTLAEAELWLPDTQV